MATIIIKSGTTSIAGATVKGNFSYFSGSTIELGPTSTTGFYSGVDAPNFGYAVYRTGGPNGVNVTLASNDTQLNSFLISIGGTGSTVNQNITWATNTNSVFINSGTTLPYTYNFNQCCLRTQITLYSTSSPIIVGSVLYTNIGLTTLYTNDTQYLLTNECPPDYTQFTGAIRVNSSGVVTTTTGSEECGA